LRKLRYVEGQNVVFEPRWGNGQVGRLPSRAAELINAKVDIIVTAGIEAALWAKQATSSIPIVGVKRSTPETQAETLPALTSVDYRGGRWHSRRPRDPLSSEADRRPRARPPRRLARRLRIATSHPGRPCCAHGRS